MSKKEKLQLRLQTKIFLLVSAAVLAISLIALFVMLYESADELKKESFDKAKEIAQRCSYEVEKELGEYMSMTRAYAVSITSILQISGNNQKSLIMENTRNFVSHLPDNSAIWALFEIGISDIRKGNARFTPYANIKNGKITSNDSGLWDHRHSENFKEIRNLRNEIVSSVFKGSDPSVLLTSFCVPMIIEDRIIGLAGIDLALSDLSDRLGNIRPIHEGSYAFMVSNDGIFVAHPWPVYFGHNIADPKFGTPQKTLDGIKNGVKFEEIRHSPLTGLDWYVYFVPVNIGRSSAPWSFGLTIPLGALLKSSNRLLWVGIINALLSSILLLGALFVIIRNISTPLQKTLGTLNKAIEQTAEAVSIIGLDRKIQLINPAMERLSGKHSSELIGKEPELTNREGTDPEDIWRILNQGNIWTGSITIEASGSVLETTITPVRGEKNNIICYLEIGRDITHELFMEEELLQAQKMEAVGTLAGGIAHDFNNILTAIMGYGELILVSALKKETGNIERYIHELLSAAERAKDLVNHILTFSRKAEQELKPVTPKFLLKEILKFLRASLPTTIEIQEKITSNASIMGDPTQFHQIMMNLCTNASQAMQEKGGILKVELEDVDIDDKFASLYPDLKPGKHVRLKVSDTGSGIAPENLEKIFDPFFTTKEKGRGTGLGLSVVHGIVKNLKGIITVQSEVGKGTEFTIYIPVSYAAIDTEEDQAGKAEMQSGTGNIMIVDDEPHILAISKEILKNHGYKVQGFTDSNAALEKFRYFPTAFDLVITDYTMPKLTGIDLAGELLKIHPDIPIVLFSGYLEKEIEEKAKATGIRAIIYKPITSKEIARAIEFRLKRA